MVIDTEKVCCPNWFDKEWLEDEIGEELFDYQWEKFLDFVNNSNLADIISNKMSQFVVDHDVHELLREF